MCALSLVPSFICFLVCWWFRCTTPACKCLNHSPGVRPHIQQHSASLISFHLYPPAILDPQDIIPGALTPVFLSYYRHDNNIPGHLDSTQPSLRNWHTDSSSTLFLMALWAPPPLSGWKVFSTSLFLLWQRWDASILLATWAETSFARIISSVGILPPSEPTLLLCRWQFSCQPITGQSSSLIKKKYIYIYRDEENLRKAWSVHCQMPETDKCVVQR